MDIIVKKGLDIPIKGEPSGEVQSLQDPHFFAFNFDSFDRVSFRILVKIGDFVKIGEPLAENKAIAGQMFVSPAAGMVKEIRRGLKRRLIAIVIEVEKEEQYLKFAPLEIEKISREQILARLMQGGIFPYITMRPFCLIADPSYIPRDIFVKAVESAPFVPSAEIQVKRHEKNFQEGLLVLSKLTTGKIHLIHSNKTVCKTFLEAEGVEKHTVFGPHPAGNSSVHIHAIAPITHPQDIVWSLDVLGVIAVGKILSEGLYFKERVVSIAGPGIISGKTGYFNTRSGIPVSSLILNRVQNPLSRFISGDPLSGLKVEKEDFLGFSHTAFSVIPENYEREVFHFLRLGSNKYTATKTYISGFLKPPSDGYEFTTNQHGEERPFIDGAVYEKFMPLKIPVMQLVKATLAEDYELAESLGLLEISPEDFALPSFVCPSKIEMMEILKKGIERYATEMGY